MSCEAVKQIVPPLLKWPAVGVAFYDPAIDTCADDVFKRADKEMYENKLAMKAQRTD